MHRPTLGRSLLALVASLALILGLSPSATAQTPTTADACVRANLVWVQVEFSTTEHKGACATSFATGHQALTSAGFTVTGTGFITHIDNQPQSAGPNAWWSYWHKNAATGGGWKDWEFSSLGATSYKPVAGSVEAWVLQADWNTEARKPAVDPFAVVGVAPAIITQPAPQAVTASETVTFTVAATGTPEPTYQWSRLVDGTWTPVDGATSATLSLTTAPTDDGAQFRATATNTVGTVTSIAVSLTINNPDATITIPDAGLRACVAKAAGVTEDKLTQAAVAGITTLSCVNATPKIADLTGVGHLKGLTSLVVSTNAITDLAPLAGSKGLTKLWFPGNQVTDLTPLAGLTGLADVIASRNALTTLAPIAGLTAMRDLSVDYNQLTDLAGVAGMTELTRLVANQNQITSLAPVKDLPKLATLAASSNRISDVAALAGKASLRSVLLAYNQITDVTPLAGLVDLTDLDVGSNRIQDVSSLAGLTKLGYLGLRARFQAITLPPAQVGVAYDLSALKDRAGKFPAYFRATGDGAADVTVGAGTVTYGAVRDAYTIAFSDTAGNANGAQFSGTLTQPAVDHITIPDAKFRACLNEGLGQAADAPITTGQARTITDVECFYAGITDLTGAEHLTALESLKLELSDITSVAPLAGLTTLRVLSLDGNDVADVAPLAALTDLRELDLDGNKLTTFDGLAPLVGLEVLTVNNQGGRDAETKPSNLTPLAGLTKLRDLSVASNHVTTLAPLATLTGLESITAYSNRITNPSGLAPLTGLTQLNLHSNGITSLAGLRPLRSLTDLNLTTNQITDPSPLAGLTGLQKLNLAKNPIANAESLAGLVNLTELTFTDAQLSSIAFTRNMDQLGKVYLHNNRLTDLSPLGGKPLTSWGALKQVVSGTPVQAGVATPLPTFTDIDGTVFPATAPRTGATVADGQITWTAAGDYSLAFSSASRKFTGTVQQTVTPAAPAPTVTVTVTADPTATPTVTATVTEAPSPAPTVTQTATQTVAPTATVTVTVAPSPSAPVHTDHYTTPGFHAVNGRHWHTQCEPYGQTVRCRTDIWATQVSQVEGRFVAKTGWYFNSLTYLPMITKQQWGSSNLANTGEFEVAGRKWRTECGTALTGPHGCRSFIWASYIAGTRQADGSITYAWTQGWLLNNIVRFAPA